MDMNLSNLWEIVEDKGAWPDTVHGVAKSETLLSNRRTMTEFLLLVVINLIIKT